MIENDPNTRLHITDCPHLFSKVYPSLAEKVWVTKIRLSVTGFRSKDFFLKKIIVGPWEVPDPPFLEEIILTH